MHRCLSYQSAVFFSSHVLYSILSAESSLNSPPLSQKRLWMRKRWIFELLPPLPPLPLPHSCLDPGLYPLKRPTLPVPTEDCPRASSTMRVNRGSFLSPVAKASHHQSTVSTALSQSSLIVSLFNLMLTM